ncbi:16S rRNA (guanine(527)-N(7))-methyltransferase RsmG [Spiroplasma endosymbiont of Aspidapion aeneum]|uniref:16S rRNA (guanine(527)-N(7))-methyltransferase RsmG n=1 Tax=Spiroplasma endosymbiont of Aspidapion aeneum TaxID=3066276 RepID=UPI00313AFBEF
MDNFKYDILNDFIEIKELQISQLTSFFKLLQESNLQYNLTKIIEFDDVVKKHYYDSLIFTKEIKLLDQKIIDVGSGAGFPGIVLKICFPNLKVFLLESNGKKANFLKGVILKLKLKDIFVINDRSESLSIIMKENFDIVVSRAMAPLNILLELTAQLINIGGTLIALKGKNFEKELEDLNKKNSMLGLDWWKTQKVYIEGIGHRVNIFYKKINRTPNIFPRSYSVVKKKPLGWKEKE